MSALPTSSALPPGANPARPEARFETLTLARLDAVLAVEQRAYSHPWTRGNFTDALASGYEAQLLMADDHLLGYFVAMMGVDEVHLLNITVTPEYQRQGWARVLLDALALWSRGRGANGCGWRCGRVTCAPSRSTRPTDSAAWATASATTPPRTANEKTPWS